MNDFPSFYITLPASVRRRQEEAEWVLANPHLISVQPTKKRSSPLPSTYEASQMSPICDQVSSVLLTASKLLQAIDRRLKARAPHEFPEIRESYALIFERSKDISRAFTEQAEEFLDNRAEARRIEGLGGFYDPAPILSNLKAIEFMLEPSEQFLQEVQRFKEDVDYLRIW